jgi:hypothetical protein
MPGRMAHQQSPKLLRETEDRDRLRQILRHAFPLSGSGSFTGVLEAISDEVEYGRSGDR